WSWTLGENATSQVADPRKYYFEPGTYDVSLKITDSLGCSDSVYKKDFIRLEGTKITYSIDTTSGCEPLRIKVSSQAMGNAEIKWDMRDENVIDSSVFSYEYARAGIYIPIAFIKDLNGCQYSLALSDTVEVVKAPAPSFDASPVCLGDSTRFINTSI